jgi:hypothetical protein
MSDINEIREEDGQEPRRKLSTAAFANALDPDAQANGEDTSFASDRSAAAGPLLGGREVAELRQRWIDIQASFVDEPRKAVEEADSLVALTMKRLAEMFADERSKLEGQWDRGDQVSTEELRVALLRYHSFFDRLLSF